MNSLPPKWAARFIDWLTEDGKFADIAGDLYEDFEANKESRGIRYARYKYLWTVLRCVRPFILRQKFNFQSTPPLMIKNYWVVTQRFILKNKIYAAINILGLAIGIACSLVLMIYVSNEVSYDSFHQSKDDIYRLLVTSRSQDGESTSAIITAAIAPTLKEELPEVEEYMRFSYPTDGFLAVENKKINVKNLLYADSTLFDVFSFTLLEGDMNSSLVLPYSILLTPKLAKSLFGKENPIGKNVSLNGEQPMLVSGIIKEAPTNSQIQYSCIISFSTLEKDGYFLDWNGGWNYFAYVKLVSQTDTDLLKSKFPPILDFHINDMLRQYQVEWQLGLQPLQDVHLDTVADSDWPNKGSLQVIYIFSTIAIITLFMASINFINLTISQSMSRLKEIGVRKAIGANQKMLIGQFLFESFIYTFFAMVLAAFIIGVFYNTINEFIGYKIDQIYLSNIWLALITGLIILIVSIGSGAYPAFYLSSRSSINSLKNKTGEKYSVNRGNFDSLVIFQFFISIILMASTWTIFAQLSYVQNKGLGFAKENVLVVNLNSKQASNNLDNLKIELSKVPEVIQTGASSALPGRGFTSNGYVPEGKELPIMIHVLDIDDSYLKTMNIELVSGRNFLRESIPDKTAFLVNETLAKEMGWTKPMGKLINRNGNHEVIGVVKDFNYASLHQKIKPLIITQAPWQGTYNYLSIRIANKNLPRTIEKIEQVWQEVNASDPFEFNFLDQTFDDIYYREQQQGKLLFIFAGLAILIGCMGLFGIISYSLKKKTKEIGVRKVLGASAMSLITTISKKYLYSIITASVLAIPLTYNIMNRWLDNFYYHIEQNVLVFIISVLTALIIAMVIINVHSLLAIRKNPTDSLKYE